MSRDLLRHRGLRARPERLSEVHGSAIHYVDENRAEINEKEALLYVAAHVQLYTVLHDA